MKLLATYHWQVNEDIMRPVTFWEMAFNPEYEKHDIVLKDSQDIVGSFHTCTSYIRRRDCRAVKFGTLAAFFEGSRVNVGGSILDTV